jgi:hypothetical protein
MSSARHPLQLLRLAVVALPLALAGCETLEKLNPFEEKKTPLAGERKTVFERGVPGVEFNAPPQQPSNSNVQLPPVGASENPDRLSVEPESNPDAQSGQAAAKKSTAKSAAKPASKSARKPDSDDPWSGQR